MLAAQMEEHTRQLWSAYVGLPPPNQEQATEWLWTYNNDRPNMAIGGITPAMKLKMAA